jgi:hypothetical protein
MALDETTRTQIIDMYKAGKKTAEITKATGAPRSSIYFVMNEEGVTPTRKSGPRSRGTVPRGFDLDPVEHQRLLDWALERVIEQEHVIAELQVRLRTISELSAP